MFTSLLLHPFADSLSVILWCLYIAIFFALCYAFCKNIGAEKIIKALTDSGCVSQETAKTLTELGVKKTAAVRFTLRKNAMIWNILSGTEKDGAATENDDPFLKKLWIAPEKAKKAESFAKTGKISIPAFLIAVIGTYFVLCALYYFLPIIVPNITDYLH